jgi:uncharacterized protein (TIGR00288 family)
MFTNGRNSSRIGVKSQNNERKNMAEGERALAVFVDFENLALGFKGRKDKRFDIQKVLERLVEKGKIVAKKAYADWAEYADYKRALHESGMELIDIPRRSMSGKNSADIRLCVDAIDLCYSKEHIDTFAIISGDSDFSPLVSKLKENGKGVIGLGMKDSSSNLLINNCDEFIYYEDLERTLGIPPKIEQEVPERKKDAFQLLVEAVLALNRENKEVLWSSMVKETMKRKKPSFNETYHGYRTFSDLLEDAEKHGIIRLRTDSRSGTYVVVGFGKEEKKAETEAVKETKERKPQKAQKPPKPRWRARTRKVPEKPASAPASAEQPPSEQPSFEFTDSEAPVADSEASAGPPETPVERSEAPVPDADSATPETKPFEPV